MSLTHASIHHILSSCLHYQEGNECENPGGATVLVFVCRGNRLAVPAGESEFAGLLSILLLPVTRRVRKGFS